MVWTIDAQSLALGVSTDAAAVDVVGVGCVVVVAAGGVLVEVTVTVAGDDGVATPVEHPASAVNPRAAPVHSFARTPTPFQQ